jgi:hypothetical protein
MVCNQNKILDEGQIKNLAEVKYMDQINQIDKLIRLKGKKVIPREPVWDSDEEDYLDMGGEMDNPDYKEPTPIVKKWEELDYCGYYHDTKVLKDFKLAKADKMKFLGDENYKRKLYEYLEIIPFNPCVMINISPDWKDKVNPKDKKYQRLLNNTIYDYLNSCNRYSKYRYCLECGGEGNFLHAHIVAEINPDLAKSVKTHINKGNHKYELQKHWKKNATELHLKGIEGLLKGKFSVQRIILNTIEMRDDKLAYLIEANKPDGHTNAFDLNFVKGDF